MASHEFDERFASTPVSRFQAVADLRAMSPCERIELVFRLQGMSRNEEGEMVRDERLPVLISADAARNFLTRIEGAWKE